MSEQTAYKKISNPTNKNICCLCQRNEATQTNSHIVPSFLGARVFSYDGSGKRGKDVVFTLTASKQKVHTSDLPSTIYEELFDEKSLTDERIEELKVDSLAKDYYLCSNCEKLLADYLESPYASFMKNKKEIPGDMALFFWLSVMWRVSITRVLGDRLSTDVEDIMRTYLFSFLEQKQFEQDTSILIESTPFVYKILVSPDYLKKDAGFINFKTNDTHNCAALICGDMAVFMSQKDFVCDFWGLEEYVKNAPINNGLLIENRCIIPIGAFLDAKKAIINEFKEKKMEHERNFLNQEWKKLNLKGEMPIELQNEIIFSIHGDGLKLGDKGEYKLWAPIIFEKITDYFNHRL